MKKREIEHIEDCCSLKEHRKCWANYDHRIDTINSCRSKETKASSKETRCRLAYSKPPPLESSKHNNLNKPTLKNSIRLGSESRSI